MNNNKILLGVFAIFALLAFIYSPVFIPSRSTPSAALVQKNLAASAASKAIPAPAAAKQALASTAKIPILDVSDPTFQKELGQLTKGYFVRLVLAEGKENGITLTGPQIVSIARAEAVARLSQTLYEAEIATVDDSDANAVKIYIPAYAGEAQGLHDYLVGQITGIINDPVAAQKLADSFSDGPPHEGIYPQNIVMTQKMIAGNAGEPVQFVTLINKTMVAPDVQGGASSSFPKNQPSAAYAPFAAFLK